MVPRLPHNLSKVKSSQNLRVLRMNPASCLPISNRRVADKAGVANSELSLSELGIQATIEAGEIFFLPSHLVEPPHKR